MIQELVQQVKNLTADMLNQIHTVLPGRIEKFNAETGLALVRPVGKFKKPDGTMLALPLIADVPVVLVQSAGQQATVAYPIMSGDGCLLLFAEQELDSWRSGGEDESKSELKFDLTSCLAIPGLFVTANTLLKEACDKQAVIVGYGSKRIAVSEAGIAVRGDLIVEGGIKASGGISAGTGSLSADGVLKVSAAFVGSSLNSGSIIANDVSVNGKLTAGGVNINTHKHTSSSPGNDTGEPH